MRCAACFKKITKNQWIIPVFLAVESEKYGIVPATVPQAYSHFACVMNHA